MDLLKLTTTMPSDARFKLNSPEVIAETFDNEVMIVNLDNGNYYSLDKVGALIWCCIEQGKTISEVKKFIVRQFNGEPLELEQLTVQFIVELMQENLLIPLTGAAEQANQQISEPYVDNIVGSEINKSQFEPPILQKFTDMQQLFLLDPIHEVDLSGWPNQLPHNQ